MASLRKLIYLRPHALNLSVCNQGLYRVGYRFESSLTSSTKPLVASAPPEPVAAVTTPPAIKATILDQVPKWEVIAPVKHELTGAILPFAQQNFLQVLLFPYTYTVMYYLDFLGGHMPWWLAIVGTTATMRILLAPVAIKQNVTGIKTHNIQPDIQRIQVKINEAMSTGDAYNLALGKTKLHLLKKEHGLDFKSIFMPIILQTPVFLTTFFLLRKLATHPLEAFTTGGALWFTDLTVPDPFYILPILTSATLFVTLEYGMEGSLNPKTLTPVIRWLIRAAPLAVFAFSYNFPAAILLFWSTNNAFTLTYAYLLRQKWVKKKLNIPDRIVHPAESLPLSNQSFSSQLKTAKEKGMASKTSMEIRRLDDIAFRKAGVGPLRKTHKVLLDKKDEF